LETPGTYHWKAVVFLLIVELVYSSSREGTILKDDLIRKKVFMSHLLDKLEQDAGTTYNNMCKEYE
jgi:hypothetical protein